MAQIRVNLKNLRTYKFLAIMDFSAGTEFVQGILKGEVLTSCLTGLESYIIRLIGAGLPSSQTVGSLLRTPWAVKPVANVIKLFTAIITSLSA
jgi:hypothetical protein